MAGLSTWLAAQRAAFLESFRGGDLDGWVVAVGNEAGDTDTLASSIALAYFSAFSPSTPPGRRYIPLQITPSSSFRLRPENIYALSLSGITNPAAELLCSDALGGLSNLQQLTALGARYALVDHNELLPIFGGGEVLAVIDHHEPSGNGHLYESADPRIIVTPVGSCASLVAEHFRTLWPAGSLVPSGVADLLLCAILLDTGNLKPIEAGGKAARVEFEAKAWLVPFSSMLPKGPAGQAALAADTALSIAAQYSQLKTLKSDVSRLSSGELLERDYKRYAADNGWTYGLSTVPLGLSDWVGRDRDGAGGGWAGLFAALEAFAGARGLDAAAILTSFTKQATEHGKKGGHAREVVLWIADTGLEPVFEGLEDDGGQPEELDLKKWKDDIPEATAGGRRARVWRMRNAKATRKQVAPRMARLVARCPPKA